MKEQFDIMNLWGIVEHFIDDEERFFEQETFKIFDNEDTIIDKMRWMEENNETHYIFYNLLVLNNELNQGTI